MAFEVGQIVGDYEVLELLGSGGMGRVYRVRNVISNRVEAMKAIQPYMGTEPELAARFSAEIRTLAAFDHPNIAQLRTAFQYGTEELMVMEFVEGSTLDKLGQQNTLTQGEVVKIVLQVLSALSYAHGRGVVHRDIKPANIMVTPAGMVKLMDFGIAKSRAEAHLTQPGSTIGSFYYMSPEQVKGAQVDGRSDLYSVGIVLYEFFSGRRPFEAETTHTLLTQQLNESPQPPIEVNPNVPKAASDLILMAMAKDPAQRFQTADAFAKALRSIASQLQPGAALGSGLGIDNVTEAAPAGAFRSPQVSPPAPAQTAWTQAQSIPDTRPSAAQPPVPMPIPAAKSHRTLWILGGALAVIVVFIAALTLAPRFSKTAAMSKAENSPAASTGTASQTPSTATSAQSAATQAPTVAAPVSTPSQSQTPPVDVSSQNSQQPVTAPPAAKPVAKATRLKSPPAQPASAAVSAPPNASTPPPAETTAQPAPQAQPSGPSEDELAQAQDELIKLNSRASTVAGSVERLQQQQAADGLGLRQDMASAYSRMNGYLQAANNDLAQRNLTAATRHMNSAEKEISTLESFFHK